MQQGSVHGREGRQVWLLVPCLPSPPPPLTPHLGRLIRGSWHANTLLPPPSPPPPSPVPSPSPSHTPHLVQLVGGPCHDGAVHAVLHSQHLTDCLPVHLLGCKRVRRQDGGEGEQGQSASRAKRCGGQPAALHETFAALSSRSLHSPPPCAPLPPLKQRPLQLPPSQVFPQARLLSFSQTASSPAHPTSILLLTSPKLSIWPPYPSTCSLSNSVLPSPLPPKCSPGSSPLPPSLPPIPHPPFPSPHLQPLKQRPAQPPLGCGVTDDGGGQLQVITRKNCTTALQQRSPTRSLQCLSSLVDDHHIKGQGLWVGQW